MCPTLIKGGDACMNRQTLTLEDYAIPNFFLTAK